MMRESINCIGHSRMHRRLKIKHKMHPASTNILSIKEYVQRATGKTYKWVVHYDNNHTSILENTNESIVLNGSFYADMLPDMLQQFIHAARKSHWCTLCHPEGTDDIFIYTSN